MAEALLLAHPTPPGAAAPPRLVRGGRKSTLPLLREEGGTRMRMGPMGGRALHGWWEPRTGSSEVLTGWHECSILVPATPGQVVRGPRVFGGAGGFFGSGGGFGSRTFFTFTVMVA